MSPRRAKAISGRAGADPATALREHLVDVAERLLSQRQVASITTRDIARSAGVSDGVLYNYFADKNDLLLAALLRRYQRIVERFGPGLPEPGTATVEENLHAYASAALELGAEAVPLAAGLITEPSLLHRFIEAIHRPPFGPQLLLRPIDEYLAGERRLGRVGQVDPEGGTTLLVGATLLLVLGDLLGGRPQEETVRQLPDLVRTLVQGLRPGPATESSPGTG